MPEMSAQPDSRSVREMNEVLASAEARVSQPEEMTEKDRAFEELLQRAAGV